MLKTFSVYKLGYHLKKLLLFLQNVDILSELILTCNRFSDKFIKISSIVILWDNTRYLP